MEVLFGILIVFLFRMVAFLVVLLVVFAFRNLLGLLESAIVLQTSTLEMNVWRKNFSSGAVGVIDFGGPFLNFIVDTVN